jgi:hypothetical protein
MTVTATATSSASAVENLPASVLSRALENLRCAECDLEYACYGPNAPDFVDEVRRDVSLVIEALEDIPAPGHLNVQSGNETSKMLTSTPDHLVQLTRYHCRYPRCGAKLSEPTDNLRLAFCCFGCFDAYYKKVCLVCERILKPRGRRPRQFCSERCRSTFRRFPAQFCAPATTLQGATEYGSRSAHSTGLKIGGSADRPWRVVAGPTPPAVNLRIPLDPATATRVRRRNERVPTVTIGPKDWPVNLVGNAGGDHGRHLDRGLARSIIETETDEVVR